MSRRAHPFSFARSLKSSMPQRLRRGSIAKLWEPWVRWASGASFDHHREQHATHEVHRPLVKKARS